MHDHYFQKVILFSIKTQAGFVFKEIIDCIKNMYGGLEDWGFISMIEHLPSMHRPLV